MEDLATMKLKKKQKQGLNRAFLFHNVPLNSLISPVLRVFLICIRFIAAEYNEMEWDCVKIYFFICFL